MSILLPILSTTASLRNDIFLPVDSQLMHNTSIPIWKKYWIEKNSRWIMKMHREQLITTVAQIAIESGERRGGEVGRVGDCTIVLVRDRRMEEEGDEREGYIPFSSDSKVVQLLRGT